MNLAPSCPPAAAVPLAATEPRDAPDAPPPGQPGSRLRCVACDGHAFTYERPYGYRSAAFRALAPELALWRCARCGLSQVDRRGLTEEALLAYYRDSYRAEAGIGVAKDARDRAWFEARARALAALAARHLARERQREENLRCFELGAGYGTNLDALRARFPRATTATDELDEAATRRHTHLRARLADGDWDLILLSHVLEHFLDPRALLLEVRAALRPGGICVIEVPNEEPAMLERHGFLEPHLSFFRLESFRHLLAVELSATFELLALGSAGPSIERPRAGLVARAARAARRSLSRVLGRESAPALDFGNDGPDGARIFLRAVLRTR
jgi:SAM-dependent methyltransferase